MEKNQKWAFLSTGLCGLCIILGIFLPLPKIILNIILFSGIIFGGFKQTKEGILELIHEKHLNVDLLMALAALGACLIGDFLEGAILTFIFSLAGSLEEYTLGKSQKELTALLNLQPKVALRVENGTPKEVPVESLLLNDLVLVPKGSQIPIDALIKKGEGLINEAAVTGESLPKEKKLGEQVFAGTVNIGDPIEIRVNKNADETLFSRIVKLVKEAQNTPSATSSFIEKIEDTYVKVVLIAVPLVILFMYFVLSWTFKESFYRGMVLLVVASPCALVASATPATLAAISHGAKRGLIFKGGAPLENLAGLKAIAFDKTGTLTKGKPVVTDVEFFTTVEAEKKTYAMLVYEMEKNSTHPLAQALKAHFKEFSNHQLNITVGEKTAVGMETVYKDQHYLIGKPLKESLAHLSKEHLTRLKELQEAGKTVVCLYKNNDIQGYFALLDLPQENAKEVLNYFKQQQIHTTILTGDQKSTGETVGRLLGADETFAQMLPEDKTKIIKAQGEKYGINAMCGDGINDAPALASATVGIAMGEGTDIAMDVADVVVMKNQLDRLVFSHKLAKKLKRVVIENIVFSLSVIAVLILSNFLQILDMPLGVVGHEGSTILVILNGLRLLHLKE